MIYNSFNFLVIFPLLFIGYYLIPADYQRARNLFLLFISYLLYLNWNPGYALVLLGITIITYWAARLLKRTEKRKNTFLIAGFISFFSLLFFKYFIFIDKIIYDILSWAGLRHELCGLNWAIPIGISFYTLQAFGYLMDVYYKRIDAEKDFLIYALFVSFFPCILSGPINKASLLIPQLKSLRPYFDYPKVVNGLKMLLWGMFMKVVVADRLGIYVDKVLPNYENYSGLTCFIASILYTIQIYADFAGYSLMAIGVGKTLGLELAENFRRPYFAVSITDFWRRWHISLSIWLRDYVYIPLGGSRCSKLRNYWNIFITFLVSGIWHGANWTFIVWGIWHGVFQIIEKAIGQQKCHYGWFGKSIKILITFLLVNFAWIIFRMPTLTDAFGVMSRIFDTSLPMTLFYDNRNLPFAFLGMVLIFLKDLRDEWMPNRAPLMNSPYISIRWATYGFLLMMIITMGVLGADQFIYINF